jgi:Invasin, domain 3/Bacterial Ig-like domain (group 1)
VVTQTATVTFAAGAVSAARSTVAASPATVVADGTTTSTITVTLRDANDNPVSGKTVSLAQGGGSSTISAAGGASSASGVVTFTVKNTVAQAVTYTATDTTDSVVIAQTATVTFIAGAVSAARSTVVASPASVVADGSTTSTITVTLRDANDNPVSGKTVTLTQGAATSTISAASGPSSAGGAVTFTVTATVAQVVTYTATDTTDGVAVAQTTTVTFTTGTGNATHSTVIASPTTVVADGATTSTITVTLKDVNDNPVSGRTVTLAQGGGGSTISVASGASSASGVVTFTVKSTVAQAVTYTATDTTDSVVIAQTATVTFTAGAPSAATSTIVGTGPVTANGVAGSTVTITVRDASGNPRQGITPAFAATGSNNVLSACTSTNGTGVATCTLASTTAEAKVLSLVSPVAVPGNTVTFVAGPAAAGNSTIAATSPVTADGVATSTVTITLKDAFDNPVGGVTPLFGVTGSGNLPGACASTSASGVSTCTLASTIAEAKTVSVTTPVVVAGVTVTFVAVTVDTPTAIGNGSTGNTGGSSGQNTSVSTPTTTTPSSAATDFVPGGSSSMSAVATAPAAAGAAAAPSSQEASPPSAVTVRLGPPVAANSSIVATGPVTADGTANSSILITLRDASNNAVANVVPTFAATGVSNVIGGCSPTNAFGTSTCRLASTKAEAKTLAITGPISLTGGAVRFVPGPVATATITGTGPVPADGVRTSTITISLKDAFDNPLPGTTPGFSASGSSNILGGCSASDASGNSTCTLASTAAEEKTLFITTPVIATGATVRFVGGAVERLLLAPAGASLAIGESRRYTVEAVDRQNNGLGDVTAGATFSIAPDGTCIGAVCTGASAGPHVVTAVRDGMTATTTVQIVYGFAGLQAPYVRPSEKSFRVKSTIPIRWQYTASRGAAVASPNAAPMVTLTPVTCEGAERGGAPVAKDPKGGGYLYDPATHTWQYEWKTTGSGPGCYAIRIASGQTGQTAGPFVIRLAE